MKPNKRSSVALAGALLPAFLMCALFYSPAIHMHQRLGNWPDSIGEQGFPATLSVHAEFVRQCFGIFVIAVGCALCLGWSCMLIPRWRAPTRYVRVFALGSLASLAVMLLAPTRFLNWWWD